MNRLFLCTGNACRSMQVFRATRDAIQCRVRKLIQQLQEQNQ